MKVKIKRVDKSLPIPQYHSRGAVAFDVLARIEIVIEPQSELHMGACIWRDRIMRYDDNMTIAALTKKVKQAEIGKVPVVMVPLSAWREIESRLEDFEMMESAAFRKRIAKSRAEKKRYSLAQVKKSLRIA